MPESAAGGESRGRKEGSVCGCLSRFSTYQWERRLYSARSTTTAMMMRHSFGLCLERRASPALSNAYSPIFIPERIYYIHSCSHGDAFVCQQLVESVCANKHAKHAQRKQQRGSRGNRLTGESLFCQSGNKPKLIRPLIGTTQVSSNRVCLLIY